MEDGSSEVTDYEYCGTVQTVSLGPQATPLLRPQAVLGREWQLHSVQPIPNSSEIQLLVTWRRAR